MNEGEKEAKKKLAYMTEKVGMPWHTWEERAEAQLKVIIFMREKGFSVKQISDFLGISGVTVYRRIWSLPYKDVRHFEKVDLDGLP